MKATLTFNLDDGDDALAHLRCVKATDMAMLLWELQTNSYRTFTKYNTNQNSDYQKGIEEVFEHIRNLFEEHDINTHKLIV